VGADFVEKAIDFGRVSCVAAGALKVWVCFQARSDCLWVDVTNMNFDSFGR
jgi:hypothetical protein